MSDIAAVLIQGEQPSDRHVEPVNGWINTHVPAATQRLSAELKKKESKDYFLLFSPLFIDSHHYTQFFWFSFFLFSAET